MNREAFHQEMKEGTIRACYLFEGEEEYTKQAALKTLQGRVLQGEFAQLNLSVLRNPSAGELIAHAETLPLMADMRFVLVKESRLFDSRAGSEGNEDGAVASGDDQDRIAAYIDRLPDSVCLVFLHQGKASAARKLYKRIAKTGGVVTFDQLGQEMLIKWMARELKGLNKVIDRETAEQLVFSVGQDMHALHGELQKLAAYAGERQQIERDDIDAVCIKTAEYKVFDLSDAVAGRRAARAARLMDELLRGGEQRLMLLALLQRQYRQMLFAKVLLSSGKRPDDVARILGVPPFVARKLHGMVAAEHVSTIRQAYDLLVDTEFQVKSGQIPEEGSLERALYRILAWQEAKRGA